MRTCVWTDIIFSVMITAQLLITQHEDLSDVNYPAADPILILKIRLSKTHLCRSNR